MKEIKLTQDKVALVSDEDYELLTQMGKWQFDRYAYCTRKVKGKRKSIRMHRLVAEKMFGQIPKGKEVDHINRDKLDNRRENLRLATRSENIRNIATRKTYGTPAGVYWDKSRSKWKVATSVNNIRYNIGRYDTKEEAIKRYEDFADEMGIQLSRG